jgi:hypothetical protein
VTQGLFATNDGKAKSMIIDLEAPSGEQRDAIVEALKSVIEVSLLQQVEPTSRICSSRVLLVLAFHAQSKGKDVVEQARYMFRNDADVSKKVSSEFLVAPALRRPWACLRLLTACFRFRCVLFLRRAASPSS